MAAKKAKAAADDPHGELRAAWLMLLRAAGFPAELVARVERGSMRGLRGSLFARQEPGCVKLELVATVETGEE